MAIDRTFINAANASIGEKALLGKIADAIDTGSIANITATAAELSAYADQPASVTQVSTPATGTNGTQFTFKNTAGATISHAFSGDAYFSNSTGLALAAVTSGAVLTNGMWQDVAAGKVARYTTTAAGLLGVTTTMTTGSYYITFVLPSGKLVTSTVLTVN